FETVRFADVTDGLTNTLLAGDKRLNLARLGRPQADDNEGYTAGFDEDTVRRTNKPPAPDIRGGGTGKKLFGSSHPLSFNVVLADASARSLSYSIDPATFSYLGNISDGQFIDITSY